MKKTKTLAILALGFLVCPAKPGTAASMATAFTYQGRLMNANTPADGLYDFQFKLFDDPNVILGNQVGITIDVNEIDVIGGYFTVELDFGGDPIIFNGDGRWLEIGIRAGELDDPNTYMILLPRQEITPTPYALYAASGTPGSPGPQGEQGPIGPQGPKGDTGDTGPRGPKGDTGATGPQGLKGDKGNTGDTGPQGPPGDSHWNLSGSNTYYNAGNVGIGTSSPDFQLEVQGGSDTAVYADSSGSNAISATSSAGGGFAAVSATTSSADTYGVWGSSSSYVGGHFESTSGTALEASTLSGYAATFMGGSVGIGKEPLRYELEVAGHIYATNGVTGNHSTLYHTGQLGSAAAGVVGEDGSGTGNYGTLGHPMGGVTGVGNPAGYFNGNVGIGTTGPDYPLDVAGAANLNKGLTGVPALRVNGAEALWYNDTYFSWGYGGQSNYFADPVGIGTNNPAGNMLAVNGQAAKPGGGTWAVYSDRRLKEVNGEYEHGLFEISKLNPVRYRYKEGNELELPTDREHIGLVAQEVQEVIPDAVEENGQGYLMLNSDPIIWSMVNAIKELKAENDALRKKHKEQVSDLSARLERIEAMMMQSPSNTFERIEK
jgi:hypothetical protein